MALLFKIAHFPRFLKRFHFLPVVLIRVLTNSVGVTRPFYSLAFAVSEAILRQQLKESGLWLFGHDAIGVKLLGGLAGLGTRQGDKIVGNRLCDPGDTHCHIESFIKAHKVSAVQRLLTEYSRDETSKLKQFDAHLFTHQELAGLGEAMLTASTKNSARGWEFHFISPNVTEAHRPRHCA
jgi:hypothetical protein